MPLSMKGRSTGAKRSNGSKARRRNAKGIFGDLGNMFLPGIGGVVGGIADGLVGNLLGGGGRGATAPVASASRMFSRQVNSSREHGTEQLTQISVPAGTPAGTILLQSLIAGPDLGVRLASFATLWTKTKFLQLIIEVISANPSTVSGNYTVAIDPDPVQSYTSGLDLPGRLAALTTSARANAWADNGVIMKPNPISLFNRFNLVGASDAEIREYACGQYIIATTTDYVEPCEYTVNLHWSVAFERPDTTESFNLPGPPGLLLDTVLTTPTLTPIISANLLIFSVADVNKMVNRAPPLGIYDLPGLSLHFQDTAGSGRTILCDQIEFDEDGTATMTTAKPTGGDFAPGVGRVTIQTPSTYSIPLSTTLSRYVRAGYALLHPWFKPEKHVQWKMSSIAATNAKARKRNMQKVLEERELEAMRYLDDEMLTRLTGGLAISKR